MLRHFELKIQQFLKINQFHLQDLPGHHICVSLVHWYALFLGFDPKPSLVIPGLTELHKDESMVAYLKLAHDAVANGQLLWPARPKHHAPCIHTIIVIFSQTRVKQYWGSSLWVLGRLQKT